jgi:hypothetical protein
VFARVTNFELGELTANRVSGSDGSIAQSTAGALPLLSHVLRETWERREGPTLTVEGYRASGGIRHAVSHSAESLYDALDAAQRSRLRGLHQDAVALANHGMPYRVGQRRHCADLDATT